MVMKGPAFANEITAAGSNEEAPVDTVSYTNTYKWLSLISEDELNNYSKIAAQICNVPIAWIELNGEKHEQDSKLDSTNMPFHLSSPLVTNTGSFIGNLILIDTKPKTLTQRQHKTLITFIDQISETISLRKRNDELATLNKELESFAYVAAHDLKSPCSSLINLSQLINHIYSERLDQDGREMLHLMELSAQTLNNLVEGILKHTCTVNTVIEPETFNFCNLMEELKRILKIPQGFTFFYDNADLPVAAPRPILLQILLNLSVNAIKYNDKPQGLLYISVKDEENHYRFTVKDNGPGIPASAHKKIFDLFTTLGRRDRDNQLGCGIGLCTVKKLVEKCNGAIDLLSMENEGCTFTFTIQKLL